MILNANKIQLFFVYVFCVLFIVSCGSSSVGDSEDGTPPSVALASPTGGEEVIGVHVISWSTNEPNKSTVDIWLSNDSGATYIEIASAAPDSGNYQWDSYQNNPFPRQDGDNFRIKIIAKDVVGNIGAPAESPGDFSINNVPEVTGQALYFDLDNNGPDAGDRIDITFDKNIQIRTPEARDFFLPVLGDTYGVNAKIEFTDLDFGNFSNIMSIVLGDPPENMHLNISRKYSPLNVLLTSASGIDIIANLPAGVIDAVDTGIKAAPSGGIDIASTFSSTWSLDDNQSQTVKLVDVDGDSDLDMLVGNYPSNYLWINNTIVKATGLFGVPGEFVDSGLRLGAFDTEGIAVGDIDGDGDVDFIGGNYGDGNKIWINENINSGNFVPHPQVFPSGDSFEVELGDLDGDGDLDLVVANNNSSQPSTIWFNNPVGNPLLNDIFVQSAQVLESGWTEEVELGDVDGDGDLDIVTSNYGDPNYVWLNDTLHPDGSTGNAGEFVDSMQRLGGYYTTTSIVLGDIDNDGDLDLVAAGNELYAQVFKNDGSGQFSLFDDQNIPAGDIHGMKLNDMDMDGDNDLVLANGTSGVDVRVNDGLGNFGASHFSFYSGDSAWDVAIGDVDKDGDLDIAAVNLFISDFDNTYLNRLWINSTYARQRPHKFVYNEQDVGNSIPKDAVAADFDKDGDQDILLGYVSAANELWTNNGSGVFTDSGQILAVGDLVKIVQGDLDNDGDEDVIFANSGEPDSVWLNDGNGILTDSGITIGTAQDTSDLELLDVDGDGDQDLVATYLGLSDTFIWLNDTLHPDGSTGIAATFIESGNRLNTGTAYSASFGDVDGDGDLDIVIGGIGIIPLPSEKVWINDGLNTGTYIPSAFDVADSTGSVGRNYTTTDIALADYDGDGDLDIYSSGYHDRNRSVFDIGRICVNQGVNTGNFDSCFISPIRSGFSLMDYDLDNDLDYVNNDATSLSWWEQKGYFTVGGSSHLLAQEVGSLTGVAVTADFNGNGFPDVFDGQKIWINDR